MGVEELSKFEFFRLHLEGDFSFFNFCLLMNFLKIPCFWEMVVNNVFVCFVHEFFLHCTLNYTHCISLLHVAFHLHNYIVYFFSTLHLFIYFFQLFVNV